MAKKRTTKKTAKRATKKTAKRATKKTAKRATKKTAAKKRVSNARKKTAAKRSGIVGRASLTVTGLGASASQAVARALSKIRA